MNNYVRNNGNSAHSETVTANSSHGSASLSLAANGDNQNDDSISAHNARGYDNNERRVDETTAQPLASQVSRLSQQRQSILRPIELTCSIELTDELDLELASIEWYQESMISNSKISRLLWRSDGGQQREQQQQQHSRDSNFALTRAGPTKYHDNGKRLNASSKSKATTHSGDNQSRRFVLSANGSQWRPQIPNITVIDYVTRASSKEDDDDDLNGANPTGANLDDESKWMPAGGIAKTSKGNRVTKAKYLRVVHLIVDLSNKANWPAMNSESSHSDRTAGDHNIDIDTLFLCRITNQAGRLILEQPIRLERLASKPQLDPNVFGETSSPIDPTSSNLVAHHPPAALSSSLEYLLATSDKSSPNSEPNNSSAGVSGLERAMIQLAHEIESSADKRTADTLVRPLFIPLEVPDWLVASVLELRSTNDTRQAGGQLMQLNSSASLATSQSRPATRQTANSEHIAPVGSSTRLAVDDASAATMHTSQQAQRLSRHQLRSIAWNLIASYTDGSLATGNMDFEPQGRNGHDDKDHIGVEVSKWNDKSPSGIRGHSEQPNRWFAHKQTLSNAYAWFRARLSDLWAQSASSHVLAVLALCVGLLIGCLLTKLIIIRVHSNKRTHRVASRAADDESSQPNQFSCWDSAGSEAEESRATAPVGESSHLKLDKNSASSHSPLSSIERQVSSSSPWSLGVHELADRANGTTYYVQRAAEDATTTGGSASSTTTGSQRKLIGNNKNHNHNNNTDSMQHSATLLAACREQLNSHRGQAPIILNPLTLSPNDQGSGWLLHEAGDDQTTLVSSQDTSCEQAIQSHGLIVLDPGEHHHHSCSAASYGQTCANSMMLPASNFYVEQQSSWQADPATTKQPANLHMTRSSSSLGTHLMFVQPTTARSSTINRYHNFARSTRVNPPVVPHEHTLCRHPASEHELDFTRASADHNCQPWKALTLKRKQHPRIAFATRDCVDQESPVIDSALDLLNSTVDECLTNTKHQYQPRNPNDVIL